MNATLLTQIKMPNKTMIDLTKEEATIFSTKYNAYKNASDTKRAERLFDMLMYAMDKVSDEFAMTLIEKETKNEPMKRFIILSAVRHQLQKKKSAE